MFGPKDIAQARAEIPARLDAIAQVYILNLESTDPDVAAEAARGLEMLDDLRQRLASAASTMTGFGPDEKLIAAQYVIPGLYAATGTLEGHAEGLRRQNGTTGGFWSTILSPFTGAAETVSTAEQVARVAMWGGLIIALIWGYKRFAKGGKRG